VVEVVLAHQGGWDEMAIFLFPVVFGGGLWWIVRRPGPEEDDEESEPQAERLEGG
jgi:hypothetical protein